MVQYLQFKILEFPLKKGRQPGQTTTTFTPSRSAGGSCADLIQKLERIQKTLWKFNIDTEHDRFNR